MTRYGWKLFGFAILALGLGFLAGYLVVKAVETVLPSPETAFFAMGTAIGLAGLLLWFQFYRLTSPLGKLVKRARILTGDAAGDNFSFEARDEVVITGNLLESMAAVFQARLQQLALEKNKTDVVLESMSDGVIGVDKNGVVVLVNRAAKEMLDEGNNRFQGKYLLEVVRNYEVDRLVHQVLATGREYSGEVRLTPTSLNIFRISVAPIRGDEQPMGVVLVIKDITHLRDLEKVRTEFVANVSHELRTPLTSIKGFVETLLDGASEDPGNSRRFLEIIRAETYRLQSLINDLMVLSRLESKSLGTYGVADLMVVVEKVTAILLPIAREKSVELRVQIPENLVPLSMGEEFLVLLLMNLLENAVKYTLPGGVVVLSAREEGHFMFLEIKDTGIGIPRESISRIFERFYRVDRARSRAQGGTGLGLAIVKHILEVSGGSIKVESTVGVGTVFTVLLPLARTIG